jgi:TPR repeat protein
MRRVLSFGVSIASALLAACATSGRRAPQPAPRTFRPETTCSPATLGVEATDASRTLRRANGVPDDVHGAFVLEVLPESPAARAGIALGDVIERVAETAIRSHCALFEVESHLSCSNVTVVVARGPARLTLDVIPADASGVYAAACRAGQSTGCFRSGWLLTGGTPQQRARAAELFDAACAQGSGAACRERARIDADLPERSDAATARRLGAGERLVLLERSCALHDASGCADLAFLYATGSGGVARDDARATTLYVAACDGGDSSGCYNVGLMYEKGRGVDADLATAAAAYEEGCHGESRKACTNLGFLYDHGHGVAASDARAAAFYEQGCRADACGPSDATGCLDLGRMHRDGRGVPRDDVRAASLFTAVCRRAPDLGDVDSAPTIARACSLLGAAFAAGTGVDKNIQSAIDFSLNGCEAGDAHGCFNLGVLYASGAEVAQDDEKAADFFGRACHDDDAEACFELGQLTSRGRGVAQSDTEAAALFEQACMGGSAKGCSNLGVLYAEGSGVPRDVARALSLYEQACDAGEAVPCFNLANRYAEGNEVDADPARARDLYAKACAAGFEAACSKSN